jgi:hypothetical protein
MNEYWGVGMHQIKKASGIKTMFKGKRHNYRISSIRTLLEALGQKNHFLTPFSS